MALTIESLLAATSTPRRSRTWLRQASLLVDLVVVAAVTVVAALWRTNLGMFADASDLTGHLRAVGVLIIIAWIGALAAAGSYNEALFGAGTEEYRSVIYASLGHAAVIGIGCYLFKFPLSRAFYVLLFLIGIPGLLVGRFILRRFIHASRNRGWFVQRVLIAGTPEHIDDVAAVLCREKWLGYSVVGCLTPEGSEHETGHGTPVLGAIHEAPDRVTEQAADAIFFAGGAFTSAAQARQAAWSLEGHHNLQIIVAPSLTDVSSERVKVRPVAGLPLVHLERPRSRDAAHWAKRAFDVGVASVLLVLFAPVAALIIAWIKLDDRGPAHFKQIRVGRDGRLFQCYKFRSMVVDAEAMLASLERDQSGHVLFKSRRDPRITRPGRLIRRLSLDELPQLWNVLRGDMSLVGPRPPLPSEVSQYGDDMLRRLNVRPGMTGLWQVSGRSDLSWEDTVRLDLYYVDNWSMIQDLAILARTAWAVVASRGAY